MKKKVNVFEIVGKIWIGMLLATLLYGVIEIVIGAF